MSKSNACCAFERCYSIPVPFLRMTVFVFFKNQNQNMKSKQVTLGRITQRFTGTMLNRFLGRIQTRNKRNRNTQGPTSAIGTVQVRYAERFFSISKIEIFVLALTLLVTNSNVGGQIAVACTVELTLLYRGKIRGKIRGR